MTHETLDLQKMGLAELTESEIKVVDGGWLLPDPFLGVKMGSFIAGVVIGAAKEVAKLADL